MKNKQILNKQIIRVAYSLLILLACVSKGSAQSPVVNTYETKLLASDGASNDFFGTSVAMSSNTVVVGARNDDDNGYNSGSLYVYRFDGSSWIETKLLASDGVSGAAFGYSVATSESTIVVGAPYDSNDNTGSGSAYIYRFDGKNWIETKLLASDGEDYDNFGKSVATSGDTVIVGANYDEDNGAVAGSAYIYRFNGNSWIETKLLASDGETGDGFGTSVAASENTVIVGAPYDDDNDSSSGSAYIYRFNGEDWIETKLTASDGETGDNFSKSVAISGDSVVVGAHRDDDNGTDSGSAYIYRFDGKNWIETKLLASDGAEGDSLGKSIAISGNTVVVGAWTDDDNGFSSGSAYIYRFNGEDWIETKLTAKDGESEDYFGSSVATSEGSVVVGAYGDSDNGSYSGSAYIVDIVDSDCPDINSDGEVNVNDLLALISVWGCVDCYDEDVNSDGIVDVSDILIIIGAWGPCT